MAHVIKHIMGLLHGQRLSFYRDRKHKRLVMTLERRECYSRRFVTDIELKSSFCPDDVVLAHIQAMERDLAEFTKGNCK